MASEIPVLPLVGSKIVAPGRRVPSASAIRIMCRAARSLIEPVGLRSSSLAQSRTESLGDRFGRPTSGVWPTDSANEAYRVTRTTRSAAGDGRQHNHHVAVRGRRAQPTCEPDVLVVDVDVDETSQLVCLDQSLLEAGIARVDVVDQRRQRVTV